MTYLGRESFFLEGQKKRGKGIISSFKVVPTFYSYHCTRPLSATRFVHAHAIHSTTTTGRSPLN